MVQNDKKKKPVDAGIGAADADLGADAAFSGGIEVTAPSALVIDAAASPAPGGGPDFGSTTAEDEEDEKVRRKERIEALRKVSKMLFLMFSQLGQF